MVEVTGRSTMLLPDFVSTCLPHDSDVPIAVVCLRDCQSTLGQCLHALHQHCLQGVEHRFNDEPVRAAWVERFYLEDAAMRLYAAAEHLANSIAFLRNVAENDLSKIRARSRWEKVRRTLRTPGGTEDLLGEMMQEVGRSRSWKFAITYRGDVVHAQPPILEGDGVRFRRLRRWRSITDGDRVELDIGLSGDEPQHAPEEVREHLIEAFRALLPLALATRKEILQLLESRGVEFKSGGVVTLNPFRSDQSDAGEQIDPSRRSR